MGRQSTEYDQIIGLAPRPADYTLFNVAGTHQSPTETTNIEYWLANISLVP